MEVSTLLGPFVLYNLRHVARGLLSRDGFLIIPVVAMKSDYLPLTRSARDHQTVYRSVRLTTTMRPAGLFVPRHTHDLTSIAFCLDGPFEETFGSQWQRVRQSSLLVRPGGGPHANRYSDCSLSRTLIVELFPSALDDLRTATRVLDEPKHFESIRFLQFGRRLELESRNLDSVAGLAIESLVYEALVWISRTAFSASRVAIQRLRSIQDYLHSHFSQPISLSDVARVAGMHPSHLAKAFRRAHGLTVGEYVRQLRIEHAARLLKERERSLAEIAGICGFYDQSHFTRIFKSHFKVSPSRYVSVLAIGKKG